MFERFTDRARRVLVLAQEESRLLNHGFIGTEHILLGLIHESDGIAARALAELDISLDVVREKVEEMIGPSVSAPVGSPPFTPRAKKVLELALREALRLGHNYIGTEHMLLGLVREGEGVAAQVLVSLGADFVSVRQHVVALLSGTEQSEGPGGTWGPRVSLQRFGARRTLGRSPGGHPTCSFCGRDLWEVKRYVSASEVMICEECVSAASGALSASGAAPEGEVHFPPRLFGTAPDDRAVDEVVALFGFFMGATPLEAGSLVGVIEDADELEPYLQEAGRHPTCPSAIRVERLRFLDDDTAEVEFALVFHGGHQLPISGEAVRKAERWLISRETIVRVLQMGGTVVSPRPQTEGDG